MSDFRPSSDDPMSDEMRDFPDPFETAEPDRDPDLDLDEDLHRDLDPELHATALLVRRSLLEHRMRPQARDDLRARLLAEAAGATRDRARSGEPGASGRTGEETSDATVRDLQVRPRRSPMARGALLGAAAGLVAVLALTHGTGTPSGPAVGGPSEQLVSGTLDSGSIGAQGISLSFSQPLDHASVESAVRISPATTVTTAWRGNTLVVTPVHGFAANAAYSLTIDHTLARTGTGRQLAQDIRLRFETAPTIAAGAALAAVGTLDRSVLAAAEEGSRAVFTGDGDVLLTAARLAGKRAGLLRVSGDGTQALGSSADAICVSRSGRSVAYVTGDGAARRIVLADATGRATSSLRVDPDPGSPLGWIGDQEVTFVADGQLRAVDRTGTVRTLRRDPVDVARDTLVIARGGRYAYLAPGGANGTVYDLTTPARGFALTGVVGAPAFTPDGAGVLWVEKRGTTLVLDRAAASGGPTLAVPFPGLTATDSVTDLAVSPDGSLLAYSVRRADLSSELRLASLPTLATIASAPGRGASPHWAPDGSRFAVLAQRKGAPVLETVTVPAAVATQPLTTARGEQAADAVVQAFVNAQIAGDTGALQWLTAGRPLPDLPAASRADVVRISVTGPRTATATIRLRQDPSDADPGGRQVLQTLTLTLPAGRGTLLQVTDVRVGAITQTPGGPQVTRVDTTSRPGSVLVTLDGELVPGTVPGGVALLRADGSIVPVTTSYDPATRRVEIRPPAGAPNTQGPLTLVVATSLRDVTGAAAADTFRLPGLVLGAA